MTIDKAGRNFIFKHEGVRLKAYKDVAGIPTIGVGFTYYPGSNKVQMGDVITQEQCDSMFTTIVATYEEAVTTAVKIPLNQNQFDALVSFAFNVGTGAFEKSTLLKRINAKSSSDLIEQAFLMWDKAGGIVVPDLLQRRKDEAALFNKSSEDETANNIK